MKRYCHYFEKAKFHEIAFGTVPLVFEKVYPGKFIALHCKGRIRISRYHFDSSFGTQIKKFYFQKKTKKC